MSDSPAPLVAADVDLRGFPGFVLDVDRLLASELVALGTPEECWAALMLWCRAWQQSPPASLPNDDRVLAAFSGAGQRWKNVKPVALRGFVECSDGRLYHRVLAAEALKAWKKRQKYQRDQARLKRWRAGQDNGGETRFKTHSEAVSEREGEDTVTVTVTDSRKKEAASADREGKPYAFTGKIIRLTQADFDRWRKSYSAIPDLQAQLQSDDDYYDRTLTGKARSDWFNRESQKLCNLHQRYLEGRLGRNGSGASLNESW